MFTNITMIRGDTLSFGLEIEGLEQDLDTAYFTVKTSLSSDENVVRKSLGDGITKAETGKYVIRMAPADTASLDAGEYYYSFEVGVNGDVFTLLIGTLDIIYDVG